jgi:tetratricopeptide (TPR) repeat protein
MRGLRVWPAAALLLAMPALIFAPTAQGQEDTLRAFSDTTAVFPASTVADSLAAQRSAVCRRPVSPVRRLKVAPTRRALGRGQALARRRLKRPYRGWVRRQGKTATRATNFGVAALTIGDPGGALAGFLTAAERRPRDALNLINASVLLTRFGRPADGLALARAALRARPPARPPMGIGVRPLALNAQGYALFHLRRYTEAVGPLNRAISAEPLLAEAKRNLAAALLCLGNATSAAELWGQGQRHNTFGAASGAFAAQGGPTEFTYDDGTRVARPESVLDMSQGQEGRLPPLTLPKNPAQGAASAQMFANLRRQRSDQSNFFLEEQTRLSLAVNAAFPTAGSPPRVSRSLQRIIEVWGYYTNWERFNPDLSRIHQGLPGQSREMGQILLSFGERYVQIAEQCRNAHPNDANAERACRSTQCKSALSSSHQQWLRVAQETDAALRALTRDLHRYGTALAANLANPDAHGTLIALMRAQLYGFYASYLLTPAEVWTDLERGHRQECIEGTQPGEAETGPESLTASLACPPELKLVGFDIKLPIPPIGSLKLGMKCESVTVGIDGPGVIAKPFGEVSYKFATGETTIYAGGKAGGPDAVDLGVKGGSFITFDRNGNITDLGIRATLSGGGSAGPVSIGGPIFKGELSLAPYVL